jgi:hypothetical protein
MSGYPSIPRGNPAQPVINNYASQVQQDIFNWTGSQVIAAGAWLNFFSLPSITPQPNQSVGVTFSSGLAFLPARAGLSQVIVSPRVTGSIGGPAGTAREWLTQLRRPDGTTVIGSNSSVKVDGTSITNRDANLISWSQGVTDFFTVNGFQLGIANTTGQSITITSLSIRIQRIINISP